MSRTRDLEHRSALLDRIVGYVCRNGLADLSLRPLAAAVDSSPRVLLYYFGSKEELLVQVIARARESQRRLFERMTIDQDASPADACRAIWETMSAPKGEPAFRLFFEVYGLALQDRARFPGFLDRAVDDWLTFLTPPRLAAGFSRPDARAQATIVIATFRGFMLDLCATRDRKRIDRAVALFIDLLDAASVRHLEQRS